MDSVLDLLFQAFADFVMISEKFRFTALGFTISLWDFYLALFVLSCVLPIFFVLYRKTNDSAGLFADSVSERVHKKFGKGDSGTSGTSKRGNE